MSEQAPAITAMMLVRDRAHLLEAAARSVLVQTDPDLELVICDDGSRDDTWRVCQHIAAADARVRLLHNDTSRGIPEGRNQVLAAARGKYLAVCDSDDLSHSPRFAVQRALLDVNPALAGVGVRINAFRGAAPETGAEPQWHWGLCDGRLPFAFAGAMLRTSAVRDAGGFDIRYPIAEDLHLAYRLAGRGWVFALVNSEGPLLDFRLHDGSITQQRSVLREWCTLRAQLRGVVELRGRFTLRGFAVICQSMLRLALAITGQRR